MNLEKNHSVLVTGATGYIGKAVVEALCRKNIRVIALVRSLEKGKSLPSSVILLEGDVRNPISYEGAVDYIIHGASVTSSQDFIQKPVDTISVSLEGTKNILDFALEKRVKKMVFLSTMEVYGVKNYENEPVTEEDYGYLDILDPRNSYPQAKRMCETLCSAYHKEKNLPVVMARLTQVFGGATAEQDTRMFAQFLRIAQRKENIILQSQGTTVRGYCHLEDAVSGLLLLLEKGVSGEAYNVCHPDMNRSVKEIAEEIAGFYGVSVEIQEQENTAYLPPFRMVLSCEKLRGLGWEPSITLRKAMEKSNRK